MSTLSLFLIVTLFAVVAFCDDYFLQFSHQAPQVGVAVDLRVNGLPVQEFSEVSYGTVAGFVNLTRYERAGDEAGVFNLTLVVSSTGDILSDDVYTFENEHYSYYVINTLTGGYTVQFVEDDFSQPEQLKGLWRVANYAPVDQDFVLTINGNKQIGFEWSSLTDYAAVPVGVYTFVVTDSNGTTVASLNADVTSGAVVTLVFNGDGSVKTPYVIQAVVDEDYSDSYTLCFVRVINTVADADYSALTPVFTPGKIVLFENVTYGAPTEYVDLEVGSYTVYFAQDDASPDDILASPTVELECEPSQFYTLTYQGLPKSTTPLSASQTVDKASRAYYEQAEVRVNFLSTSYTESLVVLVDGENVATVSYASPSGYFAVSSDSANITLVGTSGRVWSDSLEDLTLSQTYSYFVFGLEDSQDYPLSALLSDDSGGDAPSTTTTTTTTGTTGTSGTTGKNDDEDDDDDDLSGGEIAGIVIGVLVGVALLGGLLYWVIKRRERSQFSTIG